LQTLATYEHGTRHCSVARFAELCRTLGAEPYDVLARAERRVRTVESGGLRVDLAAAAKLINPQFTPLRRWSARRLEAGDRGVVGLPPAAVEQLAELCGTTQDALARQLAAHQQAVA